jgi:hypothetical protein
VDPVPEPLLLGKSGRAGNRTRDIWICSQELWLLIHWGGRTSWVYMYTKIEGVIPDTIYVCVNICLCLLHCKLRNLVLIKASVSLRSCCSETNRWPYTIMRLHARLVACIICQPASVNASRIHRTIVCTSYLAQCKIKLIISRVLSVSGLLLNCIFSHTPGLHHTAVSSTSPYLGAKLVFPLFSRAFFYSDSLVRSPRPHSATSNLSHCQQVLSLHTLSLSLSL